MSEFTVRPFAFMRLTHEALRAGLAGLVESAEAGDLAGVRSGFGALRPVIRLHAQHEEQVFFPMLDRLFDGAVEKGGLRDAHVREEAHEERLASALETGDLPAARAAVADWQSSFEAHLVDEEELMMPLTAQVAPTQEGRAAAVREILELDWAALKTVHLPYVAASLAANKPYGPVRMFVAALQSAADERYAELEPVLRAALPAPVAASLQQHGHLS